MIDPKNVESLFNKALALYDLGENDEDLICIEKALTIDPTNHLLDAKSLLQGEFFMACPIFPNQCEILNESHRTRTSSTSYVSTNFELILNGIILILHSYLISPAIKDDQSMSRKLYTGCLMPSTCKVFKSLESVLDLILKY